MSKVGKKDPFEGPEYGPGEHVLDLKQNGGKYSIVHNLHALFPGEFPPLSLPSLLPFSAETDEEEGDDRTRHGHPAFWQERDVQAADE